MKKQKIEDICRRAGMTPETRANIEGAEVFIADGCSLPPHDNFRRFGIAPKEFPGGVWATLWWVSRGEDELDIGRPLFFDLFHDPNMAGATKKTARVNAALAEARFLLDSRKKARHVV